MNAVGIDVSIGKGTNKFLRIYYGQVRECLASLAETEES